MSLEIRTVVSRPFQENTYLVWRAGQAQAVVIDPGLEPEEVFRRLEEDAPGLTVAAILNTHGHADHIAGNEAFKRAYPAAPLVIGADEVRLLGDPEANLSAYFDFPLRSPPADRTVREGDRLDLAGIAFEVLDIPGHSPGHVAFVVRGQPAVVFAGDVLFAGSIGRYDFPGGDGRLLVEGIRRKLFTLPDDTVVYPGHGPATTTGEEKRNNPFVGE